MGCPCLTILGGPFQPRIFPDSTQNSAGTPCSAPAPKPLAGSGKRPLEPSKSHKTPAPAPSRGAPGGCGGPDEAAFVALLNQVSGVSSGQRSRLAPALGAEHGNSEADESSSGSVLPWEKDLAALRILPAAPRRKCWFGGLPVIPAPPQAGIREGICIGRSGSKSRLSTAAPWLGFHGIHNSQPRSRRGAWSDATPRWR